MDLTGIIVLVVVGIVAGWLGGLITKGHGFGLVGNMVIGIIGAFIGKFIFGYFGILTHGVLGLLLAATLGAVTLIVILGVIRKLA